MTHPHMYHVPGNPDSLMAVDPGMRPADARYVRISMAQARRQYVATPENEWDADREVLEWREMGYDPNFSGPVVPA